MEYGLKMEKIFTVSIAKLLSKIGLSDPLCYTPYIHAAWRILCRKWQTLSNIDIWQKFCWHQPKRDSPQWWKRPLKRSRTRRRRHFGPAGRQVSWWRETPGWVHRRRHWGGGVERQRRWHKRGCLLPRTADTRGRRRRRRPRRWLSSPPHCLPAGQPGSAVAAASAAVVAGQPTLVGSRREAPRFNGSWSHRKRKYKREDFRRR